MHFFSELFQPMAWYQMDNTLQVLHEPKMKQVIDAFTS